MYNEYNEVIEILNYIPKEDFNKIPIDKINMFKANINPNYHFKYDPNKTLQEQNVSKEARIIIAILFRDYWATPNQKEKIIRKEKFDIKKIENEKKEKYNSDNIFKKQNNINEISTNTESVTSIAVVEEKWYKKIFNLIKIIFNRKKK